MNIFEELFTDQVAKKKSFSTEQMSLMLAFEDRLSLHKVQSATENGFGDLTEDEKLLFLELCNATYRAGYPLISDIAYDGLLSHVSLIKPDSPFLNSVEPEAGSGKYLPLPKPMLSTTKFYSMEEVTRWTSKILAAADELGVERADVKMSVKSKLDGFAGLHHGGVLYSRGDGERGRDLTHVITKRGLQIAKGTQDDLGAGEIVVEKAYFDSHLSEKYENPRNVIASIIAESQRCDDIKKCIETGHALFYPFSALDGWCGTVDELLSGFDEIIENAFTSPYPTDGAVIQVENEDIREHMGSATRYHRWQCAYKINAEAVDVEVLSVTPQTTRTSRINPVLNIKPIKLNGSTISRVTAHNYQFIKDNKIGAGAIVGVVLAGEIIPSIVYCKKKAATAEIPDTCPCCQSTVEWDGCFIRCANPMGCSDQKASALRHFLITLSNVDGFGLKVLDRIVGSGVESISDLYRLSKNDFSRMGFGEKTSANLFNALAASKANTEDWRFLAGFGISGLGRTNSKAILSNYPIDSIFDLTKEDIVSLDGFGDKASDSIMDGLDRIKEEFYTLINDVGFNLKRTEIAMEAITDGNAPLNGLVVCFTGKMESGTRDELQANARELGAKVVSAVSGKLTYLVTGERVGATKIKKAEDLGVKVITEFDYLKLIK